MKGEKEKKKRRANRCCSVQSRLICVDPCVTCRTYRTCVNASGSSKAASGQSTHIKRADSRADEAQARLAAASPRVLLVRIPLWAKGLMEEARPSSDRSAPSLVHMLNLGDSGVSKWTPEPTKTSLFHPPPPLYHSFLINEDKLSFSPDCISG